MEQIPFTVYETTLARFERSNKRMWIACLILIFALMGTNAGWIIYESQFATTEVSQEVDTGDGNATVIGVGDYDNGESTTNR